MKTLNAGSEIKGWKVKKSDDNGIELIDTQDGLVHATITGCTTEALALIKVAPELLEALKEAQNIISMAREYFPKSIRNTDRYSLENTCATIGSAIAKAEGK